MKEHIVKAFDDFQIADLDDDMVGMCKALVDWLHLLRSELGNEIPSLEPPDRFYKLHPHQPRMELRKNLRNMLAYAVKGQVEEDDSVKLKNIFVAVVVATYIYHMPTQRMLDVSLQHKISREEAEEILLSDDMSPNWIKEPSGKDFTAIML